jgi:hypothetical protein
MRSPSKYENGAVLLLAAVMAGVQGLRPDGATDSDLTRLMLAALYSAVGSAEDEYTVKLLAAVSLLFSVLYWKS